VEEITHNLQIQRKKNTFTILLHS